MLLTIAEKSRFVDDTDNEENERNSVVPVVALSLTASPIVVAGTVVVSVDFQVIFLELCHGQRKLCPIFDLGDS